MIEATLREMAEAYFMSPKGQALIREFLSSPEGQRAIDGYLSTPQGQQMAFLLLERALEKLEIPADVKETIRQAISKGQQGRG